MLADGFLSPIDTARAKLQDQIGMFLSGRQKLIRLMDSKVLTIQGQARGLYSVQTSLESRLQNEITPILSKLQAGTWDYSDLIPITGFTMQVMKQIDSVNNLERQAGGIRMGMFDDLGTVGIVAIGGVVLLGVGILSGAFFKGRSQTQS